ncbi:MAG: Eco57I restriction-modification methylase domain-containing protein [Candidatus Thiothrix putei]|uniref:site-specific DNA-methyltransferase (adenine-specific) n=1 Tax=Candidatus Thiothrix putei TaxID=3080811 RepID=A0AA95HDK3_9GAMM|nr:MAG: Eco57I restriction-modification methylase domain-containing protein [Candidatus Thiothrix putei]
MNSLQFNQAGKFTHALLNPPYQKIRSDSLHRTLLRQVGIETVNLYSAFVALTLLMMVQGGQVVALIPRSFCNGPYYRPFRELLLKQAAIRHIHLFGSRSKTFKSDGVLQENVIVVLERGSVQGDVTITHSTDGRFADMVTHRHPFSQVVRTDDSEYFIHVPTSSANNEEDMPPALRHSLDEVAIQVSTGPVVDFRLKEYLRNAPEVGTVPLLYPTHFTGEQIVWPKLSKKPNAIQCNVATEKWLYPSGFYCVVRRFSSKEEARRIVASVVYPEAFGGAEKLGFENHLNVFHEAKQGLPKALAYGLAVYLNTTWVDERFRRSSGHTQVNATDLRVMKYPSRQALMALGEWAMCSGALTQGVIDEQVAELGEL